MTKPSIKSIIKEVSSVVSAVVGARGWQTSSQKAEQTLTQPLNEAINQNIAASVTDSIETANIPKHIGFILDGNRRYARRYGLSLADGYSKGAAKVEELMQWMEEFDIRIITLWAFSLDNFRRPAAEVDQLMHLFRGYLQTLRTHPHIHKNQVRLAIWGQRHLLDKDLVELIEEIEEKTKNYQRRLVNVCMAYGGREEIIDALRKLLEQTQQRSGSIKDLLKNLSVDDITENLQSAQCTAPELIIRTSGEKRISGFLMWQSTYSEYYFCSKEWPEFSREDLKEAILSYQKRERRYGR